MLKYTVFEYNGFSIVIWKSGDWYIPFINGAKSSINMAANLHSCENKVMGYIDLKIGAKTNG